MPAVTGLRFALEPGTGRSAVPVRSAIVGTVLAGLILTATFTFGSSLTTLVSHPALYGWNWNYVVLSGYAGAEDLPAQQTATFLDRDPRGVGLDRGQLRHHRHRRPVHPGCCHRAESHRRPAHPLRSRPRSRQPGLCHRLLAGVDELSHSLVREPHDFPGITDSEPVFLHQQTSRQLLSSSHLSQSSRHGE